MRDAKMTREVEITTKTAGMTTKDIEMTGARK